MRLALQALFARTEANEEGAARRAELERRLRASERSAGFFRRLRVAVDDPSLQAPEIFAVESFPDANVVAEYLDGQAPSDLARDYEDACWDSPEMLAEIGRCCDILNNDALNSVVAPKNCRRRLYYIAWEENDVNVWPENAPILTKLAAPAEDVSIAVTAPGGEREEFSQETASPKEERADRVSQAKKKEKKRPLKSRKSSNSVGTALAERSWGRRAQRWGVRAALASLLLTAGYCGWQTLKRDVGTEVLPREEVEQKLVAANRESGQNADEEAALRPTTISTSNLEVPEIALGEYVLAPDGEAVDALAGSLNEESEPPKLAALPNLTLGKKEESTNVDDSTTNAAQIRVGLGGDEPWNRRPTIEIPEQNNDVFTKTKLY